MVKANRLGATLTAIGLVGALAACSTSGPKTAMHGDLLFGKKVDTANIGLATRAQMALASNDIANATDLAERAVENSPSDAGFRALLGNCYLAAGRFASAEAAYRDSLSLVSGQPQVALKLALVQTALGNRADALAILTAAQGVLDPADIGLAVALAGRPDQAIEVLEPAARGPNADARLRQNLALAYALAGNWDMARVVTEQDVPADQVDARLDQFRALAKPGKPGTAVASFIGVTPASSDPGQPVRLALGKTTDTTRLAAVKMPVAPAPVAAPAPAAVAVVETPMPMPMPRPMPVAAPVRVASAPVAPAPVKVAVAAPISAPAPVKIATVMPAPKPAPVKASIREPRPALSPAAVRLSQPLPQLRHAALRKTGASTAVVQLGAFSSSDRVELAWNHASARFAALRPYQPMSAQYSSPRGTVYRLSIKGFASNREAIALCAALKRAGRACFVRPASGDAPVEFASR